MSVKRAFKKTRFSRKSVLLMVKKYFPLETARKPLLFLTSTCVVLLLILTTAVLNLGSELERGITHRLIFSVRSALKLDPELAKSLKIFSLDDPTIAYLNSAQPTLEMWADIIQTINKSRPKRIIIDKIFDMPESGDQIAVFLDKMGVAETKLYSAAFSSPMEISQRKFLNGDLPFYLKNPEELTDFRKASWFSELPSLFTYGPHPALIPALAGVGHINYEGNHTVRLVTKTNSGLLLPHLALAGVENIAFSKKKLHIDKKDVPTDESFRVLVDVSPPDVYRKQSYSLKAVIQSAERGLSIPVVNKNDTVVIVPGMYTGSTDWTATPHGMLPGGYVIAAMVNSVLTGKWIRQVGGEGTAGVLLSAVGIILAFYLSSFYFSLVFLTFHVVYLLVVILCFIYGGTVLPWIFPAASSILAGAVTHIWKLHFEAVNQAVKDAELETARVVQNTYMPSISNQEFPFSIHTVHQAATQCSGDWWLKLDLGFGRSMLLIGDASGHGVPAALATACVHSVALTVFNLHRESEDELSPGRLLRAMDEVMTSTFKTNIIMTLFAIKMDSESNVATYSNAAHIPPLLMRNGQLTRVNLSSNPLGFNEGKNFKEAEIYLEPGDRIFFYTDGLTEATDHENNQYGYPKLRKRLLGLSGLPASALLKTIWDEYRSYTGKKNQEDDITIVLLDIDRNWRPHNTSSLKATKI